MTAFVRQHKGAVLLSVVLHIAIVAALTVGFRLPSRARAAVPTQVAIEAVVVDQAVLDREIQRRERIEREAVQRRQREERQAREREQQAREAEDLAKRQEQQRQEQIRLDRERAESEARAKAEAEKREQERLAEEQRQREQREREEAAKREREAQVARQQRQAEDELQRALAAEDERRAAEEAGLMDQYIRLIQDKIERSWIPPVSARAGLECTVAVVQIPGGDVIDARVTQCNGDEAVVRSIEAAVRRASPLPKPPDPSLFERNLNVIFRPDF
jgi:colicin import membrane protein